MEKYGINQASLANRLGKNQSTISNKKLINAKSTNQFFCSVTDRRQNIGRCVCMADEKTSFFYQLYPPSILFHFPH